MGKFVFNDLKKYRDKIGKALSDTEIDNCLTGTIKKLGGELQRLAIGRTPTGKVNGGTLKKGWKFTKPEKVGAVRVITVYNNTEYAIYVEKGHWAKKRKDGSRKFVKGYFLLEKSINDMDKIKDRIVGDNINKLLRGGFK